MNKKLTKKEYQIMKKIMLLKRNLKDTDYRAIKYAEGEITPVEYQETKEKRKAWRAEINALETTLQTLKE